MMDEVFRYLFKTIKFCLVFPYTFRFSDIKFRFYVIQIIMDMQSFVSKIGFKSSGNCWSEMCSGSGFFIGLFKKEPINLNSDFGLPAFSNTKFDMYFVRASFNTRSYFFFWFLYVALPKLNLDNLQRLSSFRFNLFTTIISSIVPLVEYV